MGIEAKEYIAKGELVPDSLMVGLVSRELEKVGGNPWLLDGFPRSLMQAKTLQTAHPVKFVINLSVPFDVIVARLEQRWIHESSGRIYNLQYNPPKIKGKDDLTGEDLIQREDDKPESIRRRLEVFRETIEPLLEYYRNLGTLKDFQGTESSHIWQQLDQFLRSICEN